MTRYPSYRPVDFGFLDEIPAHWKVMPFRRVFRESAEINGPTPVGEMLSISGYRGVEVKQYDSEAKKRTTDELETYRVVRPGQLAVNTMWLNYAGLGVSEHLGHVSPAYRSYFISPELHERYAHHLMRCSAWVSGYTARLTGIRPNSLQLSRDNLMSFPVVVPPMEEQRRIADYLDHETAEIDALIADLQELDRLLAEHRTSSIEQSFSNSNLQRRRLKDIGVKKTSGYSANGGASAAQPHELGVLKTGSVSKGFFDPSENKVVDDPDEVTLLNTPVSEGTVIVNRANTPSLVGAAGYVAEDHHNLFVSDLLWELTLPEGQAESFYFYTLTRRYREQIDLISVGASSTMKKIRFDDLSRLVVPFPIEDRLDAFNAHLRIVVARHAQVRREIGDAIKLATERRAALISAAVTGQIDVTDRHRGPSEAERLEEVLASSS